MRTLVFVCAVAIFIALLTSGAYARVIGGDLDNAVAVYYFSSLMDSGSVPDYGGNGLHGSLFDGAQLSTVSGRQCLSLGSNDAQFSASDDNKSLLVSKEFSIVAWVRIPRQSNEFLIRINAYNGPIADMVEGTVELGIGGEGILFGTYYNGNLGHTLISRDEINDNQWQHIGFVVNNTSFKLYLNGNRINNLPISEHESFGGTGSLIQIGTAFVDAGARGSVDDVGFFKNDLTEAQVRLIYNRGLASILSIASVWGALKQN